MWVVLFLVFGLFVLILIKVRLGDIEDKNYFEKRGVIYLGNRTYSMLYQAFRKVTIAENSKNLYFTVKSRGQKFAGQKEFGTRCVLITDPELLKHITIKDFPHFTNRRNFEMPKEEILFSKMLFSLKGETWKKFRSTISPALSTRRMRRVYKLFSQSGNDMINYLNNQIGDEGTVESDFFDTFAKFTIEIIASAVCGLESKAFHSAEKKSVFEEMSRRMELHFSGMQMVKLIVILVFPYFGNLFKLSIFDRGAQDYLIWAIRQTIKLREQAPDKSWDDFIQLMIEARRRAMRGQKDEDVEEGQSQEFTSLDLGNQEKSSDKGEEERISLDYMTDDHIVANCVLFILAGYDTTQSALLFGVYALALHPEIQERLRAEIEVAVESEDKEREEGELISYNKLHSLKYLDMFFHEVLRKYPPTAMVDRGCAKDYKFPGSDFVLKKGEGVIIPIAGFHADPDYFENPEVFDPERFSDENKHKINPYAYVPFGLGRRACIGYRFASTEAKLGLAILVYNYKIEPSAKTSIPMVFKTHAVLKPKDGMKVNISKIQRESKI